MSNEIAVKQDSFSLTPRSVQEAMQFADMLSKSDIVPKEYQGKAANILVAVQWGAEIGLQPMQAMQSIAVINGRPSLWGDASLALVRASSVCEHVYESMEGDKAVCRVKRRGEEEQVRTFDDADAKTAGLLDKAGPWKQYPRRMKQLRARAFALRDVFTDILRGMAVAEELMDYEPAPAVAHGSSQAAVTTSGAVTGSLDPDLLKSASEAAEKGIQAYQTWWKKISIQQRAAMTGIGKSGEHEKMKARAAAVDEARVVATQDAKKADVATADAGPAPTYAELMQRLQAATEAGEVLQVVSDSAHLPADQQQEIRQAAGSKVLPK